MRTPVEQQSTSGTTWKVRYRLDGRQSSHTFLSDQKAQAFCRDLEDLGANRAIIRLEESQRRAKEPLLDEVFEEFVAWKTPRVVSDRTPGDYRRDYRLWIQPTFGHRRAVLITPEDVQDWVDAMVEGRLKRTAKPAAAKSIIDRHALLHQVMGYAIRRHHRVGNPCSDTDLPRKIKGTPKGMYLPEWQALHAALTQINPDAADLALFLLASGWRWSEATALTTYNVEDSGTRMWVTMDAVMRRNAANQVVSVVSRKGEGSMRRIEMDAEAAAMIRRHVSATRPGALVFTTGVSQQNGLGGSQWHYGNFLTRCWNPAVEVANLGRRPTPHWLRHTAVFWLAITGASLAELQSRIGHRNIGTTLNTYGSMVTDVQPEVLVAFAAMRHAGAPPSEAPEPRVIEAG